MSMPDESKWGAVVANLDVCEAAAAALSDGQLGGEIASLRALAARNYAAWGGGGLVMAQFSGALLRLHGELLARLQARGGAVRDLRDALLKAPALPARVSSGCFCGGALRECAEAGQMICAACGRLQPGAPDCVPVGDDSAALRAESDYHKTALAYLRRLQGCETVAFPSETLTAIQRCARRDRVTGRTATLAWMRGVLQELELSKQNELAPSLLCWLFQLQLPQLTESEEQQMAHEIEQEILAYLSDDGTAHRKALPCAYLAYRQICGHFPPGAAQRVLLRMIHLPERATFEKYQDAYWRICERLRKPFRAIELPPEVPFSAVAPRN